MPSDESKGNQLDAIGSLAQRQLIRNSGRSVWGSDVKNRAPSGVVLSRCHLQRLPRFIHSGWPSGRGKLDNTD